MTGRKLYRILAQTTSESTEGIMTIVASSRVHTQEQAQAIGRFILTGDTLRTEDYSPVIVEEIASEEDWERGACNYCPRCGKSVSMEPSDSFECYHCYAYVHVDITVDE